MVEEQVYLKLMPPKKKKKQPGDNERQNLFSIIESWNALKGAKSKFKERFKSPEYGNYVDHDNLFSGKYK